VTVAEIRAGYEQSIAMMDSWWVKFHGTFSYPEAESVDLEYEWALDRQRVLFRSQRVTQTPAPLTLPVREFLYGDGKTTWLYSFAAADPNRPVFTRPFEDADVQSYWSWIAGRQRTRDQQRSFMSFLGFWFLGGPHDSFAEKGLRTLLANSAHVKGREMTGGADCWHVVFDPQRGLPDEPAVAIQAWFDPEAGWWPRRIVLEFEGGHRPEYALDSFARVETPAGPFWFPTAWSRRSAIQTQEYTVDEFKFNEPLGAELFKPPIPEGVEVVPLSERSKWELERRRTKEPPPLR
jgi:hypothetical protein